MPFVRVPLTRYPNRWRLSRQTGTDPPSSVAISCRVQGTGPVLVLMVPGFCVPASMYDSMAAVLSATSQFTTIVMDNRGMGLSDAPPSTLLGGIGYTVSDLAADSWAVVDAVAKDVNQARTQSCNDLGMNFSSGGVAGGESDDSIEGLGAGASGEDCRSLYREVALVGHSMGGMIIQEMVCQRPKDVRFAGLLSTHAGGAWNLIPTASMLTSVLKVAWSGFDRDVHAAVNLSLHFTQRFLDAWVVPDLDFEDEISSERGEEFGDGEVERSKEGDQGEAVVDNEGTVSEVKKGEGADDGHDYQGDDPLRKAGNVIDVGYFESKMVDLVRDARVYFGLSDVLTDSFWKPRKSILNAIAKNRRRARRRRREIYHDKYTGAEPENPAQNGNVDMSSSSSLTNPEDSPHAFFGHAAVVRSHTLSKGMARQLQQCRRIVKLVMTGRHDMVITPSSSRALAAAIGANTVVEVEAAHFIADEAVAEVTTHVIYGLRKAFFALRSALPCECEWCVEPKEDMETQLPNCRMC